jgi:hypothetical protein
MRPWRDFRPVVEHSPSFDKEQDLYPNTDYLREKLDRFRI